MTVLPEPDLAAFETLERLRAAAFRIVERSLCPPLTFQGVKIEADPNLTLTPYSGWRFRVDGYGALRHERAPTAEDTAVHRAISLPPQDEKRMGCAQYVGQGDD